MSVPETAAERLANDIANGQVTCRCACHADPIPQDWDGENGRCVVCGCDDGDPICGVIVTLAEDPTGVDVGEKCIGFPGHPGRHF